MKNVNLPEPKAVKEVHAWRRKLQRRAEKVGWKKYLADLNERPSLLEPRQSTTAVRERPSKYKAR